MKAPIGKGIVVVALASLAIAATPALSSAAVKNFMTVINGAQETPPATSAAIGNGILTYDTKTKTLCYYFSYIGALAGGEIAAHIHGPSVPGVPSGIVVALPLGTTKQGCVVNPPAPFSHKDLFKNLYYINIHSGGFPGGEIRGQIYRIK
jgi:hypothetical protein